MTNRPRKKGTAGEVFLLPKLQTIWPGCARAGTTLGSLDAGDYTGTPHPVEMKNTAAPRFLEWVRVLRRKAPDHRWLLVWKGDCRTQQGQPLAVMDLEYALELLASADSPEAGLASGPDTGVGPAASGGKATP